MFDSFKNVQNASITNIMGLIKKQEKEIVDVKSSLKTEVETQVKAHIEQLEGSFQPGTNTPTHGPPDWFKEHLDAFKDLQDTVVKHTNQVEQLEINDRLCVLIIDGLKHKPGMDLVTNVINAISYYLGVNLSRDDFVRCHRFGPDSAEGLPKSVMVRFNDPVIKQALLRLKPNLRFSPYISENFLLKNKTQFLIMQGMLKS